MSINNSKSKIKNIEVLRRLGGSLTTVCSNGDMENVVNILENGADINFHDTDGRTPLYYACMSGHEEIVNYLLCNGAILKQTKSGRTPLHAAAINNRNKIVHILLQNIESNNDDGEYFNCSYDKHLRNSINSKNSEGSTALHFAAEIGSLEIVNALLMYGAIYNIQDTTGKTPIDVTSNVEIKKRFGLIEELFKDAQNGEIAVINKLKTLTENTISVLVNARNNEGKTLYRIALDKNHGLADELENLSGESKIKMDQLEYLKKASYHILISIYALALSSRSVTSQYFNSHSYSGFVVENLKEVYKLVKQYKSWVPGIINNREIASLNKLLRYLAYDPRYVTADKAYSFVSKRQSIEYFDTYYSVTIKGWRQILESVNKHVDRFYESITTKLRALYFDNLVQVCEIGDSSRVRKLLTRIRNESPDSVVSSNEMAPLFEVMYCMDPLTIITLKTSDGLTPLQIAALSGHLEVVKTLSRHGAVYNNKSDKGETAKSLSKNRAVIDFLSLLDSAFDDVEKGDMNVLNKLTALDEDDFLAVTRARNLQGNALLQVAEKNKHNTIARSLKKLMENSIINCWR